MRRQCWARGSARLCAGCWALGAATGAVVLPAPAPLAAPPPAEAARKVCVGFGFQSAKEVEQQRQATVVKISTGCAALDELLGGGIETKAVRRRWGVRQGG